MTELKLIGEKSYFIYHDKARCRSGAAENFLPLGINKAANCLTRASLLLTKGYLTT